VRAMRERVVLVCYGHVNGLLSSFHSQPPLTVAYAQIDWHDFVVVQTIDFTPADVGALNLPLLLLLSLAASLLTPRRHFPSHSADLPPPITISELGQRLLDMDRVAGAPVPNAVPPPAAAPPPAAPAPPPAASAASDAMDIEVMRQEELKRSEVEWNRDSRN
jgi:hypothetical protein